MLMATQVEERRRVRTCLAPRYRVLLHDDDVHDMGFVASCVSSVFALPWSDAWAVMMEAHCTGVGLCCIEAREKAEGHRDRLRSLGLTATVEPDAR